MAKSGNFKCTKCDRTFSMAPHLGRHMATIHKGKLARGAVARRPRKKAAIALRAQTGGTARLLSDIRAWRNELAAQQVRLATQLESLDELLATFDRAAPKPTAGRALKGRRIRGSRGGAREGSLKSYIERVIRAARKPMRRVEITAAVLKAGYKSRNKTLAKSVGVALRTMPSVKRIGRGVFRAK